MTKDNLKISLLGERESRKTLAKEVLTYQKGNNGSYQTQQNWVGTGHKEY